MFGTNRSQQAQEATAAGGVVENNTILRPGTHATYIPNKLGKATDYTLVRFLTPVGDDGHFLEPLNPHGDVEKPYSCLGAAFARVELADLYINRVRHTFISTIHDEDGDGNQIPFDMQTPLGHIANKCGWNAYADSIKRSKGYPRNVPETWDQFKESGCFTQPSTCLLLQVFASTINSVTPLDSRKQPTSIFGVFAIKPSAEKAFLPLITTKIDPNGPLVGSNIPDHARLLDPVLGHAVYLKRRDEAAKAGGHPKINYVLEADFRQVSPLDPKVVSQFWIPWERVLNIPTVEEQVEMLVSLLGAEAVDFGLKGTIYERYVPASVIGASAGIEYERRKKAVLEALPIVAPAGHGQTAHPQQSHYPQQPQHPQQPQYQQPSLPSMPEMPHMPARPTTPPPPRWDVPPAGSTPVPPQVDLPKTQAAPVGRPFEAAPAAPVNPPTVPSNPPRSPMDLQNLLAQGASMIENGDLPDPDGLPF